MTIPNNINDRIALAKGWTWDEAAAESYKHLEDFKELCWRNLQHRLDVRPDYVGTLEGIAELMRELQSRRRPMSQWAWYWNGRKQRFVMRHSAWRRRLFHKQIHAVFHSRKDQPGRCIGRAWMSMFGKDSKC